MKKSIFTLAICALVASSMSLMAQEVQEEMPPMPAQGGNNNLPMRVLTDNPLTRNLDLTEEQKIKLESIENPFLPMSMERRAAHNREAKSPREMNKAQCQEQAQDSVCCKDGNVEPASAQREQRLGYLHPDNVEEVALMRGEYLRKVKKILTQEQYMKYMENLLMYMAPQPKEMGGFQGAKMHKRGPKSPHTRGNTELIR